MPSTAAQLLTQVGEAGYKLVRIEQLRANRWLLTLESPEGQVLVMAQQRPLISAADVQDLAEQLRLGRFRSGYLLAIGGRFSPEAQRTAAELRQPRILLCTSLPPAGAPPRISSVLEIAS
jgi:hypothetical protein